MSASVDSDSAGASASPASCRNSEVESSERARQREIAAYLSAASFPPGLPAAFQEKASLCTDPTLNALTQLGALRLNYQYVICEMTRSHSFVDLKCDPGDTVAIGVCKLRNCDGVCPATMKAFMDETGEWVKTGPEEIANRTRYIINNFKTHPNYKDRPYVVNYPYFTSYLEVPLVSPLGYLLGSYCVVDSKYNDFDNDHLVEIMNEISASIMSHLENVRVRQNRDRSEKLIRGLSAFIKNELPMTSRLRDNGALEDAFQASASRSLVMNKFDGRGDDSTDATSSDGSERQLRPKMASLSSHESTQSGQSLATPQGEASETPPTTPRDDSVTNPMEDQLLTATAQLAPDHSPSHSTSAPSEPSESHGFITAATIQQTMDLDGLMFLDAVPSSYLDRPDQPSLDSREAPCNPAEGPFCATIVKSIAGQGTDAATHQNQFQLPEVSLQRFIKAYPRGHVFTADELGPIDDSYGVGKPFKSRLAADKKSLRLRNDIAALFRVLPAAKYIIFYPLWHFQRECWYAATLAWVEDPIRAINVGDLGLVSAFGSSVMAEVSRLETLAASRAKSDFVSSLSHELRSPLHGIMASSELVREGISNQALLSTLDMLDSCATTLLDTFNNLLDHAVVNHSGLRRSPGALMDSAIREMDLGALVEDVVEVVRMQARASHRKRASRVKSPSSHPLPVNVGAWKRIYTDAGRIEIELKVVKRTDRAGKECDYVSFTVEDTGAGMSSDFINHAPGMGLGLSIVRQLSSLGYDAVPPAEQPFSDEKSLGLNGQTVCLITPDACVAEAGADFSVSTEVQTWWESVEKAIRANATGFLGTKVKVATKNCQIPSADIYLLDCNSLNGLVEEIRNQVLQTWHTRVRPLVLLCSGSGATSCFKQKLAEGHSLHLNHPIAPRKLSSVFRLALQAKSCCSTVQICSEKSECNTTQTISGGSTTTQIELPVVKMPIRGLKEQLPPPPSEPEPSASVGANSLTDSSRPSVPVQQRTRPNHLLLVDDNPINLKLLIQLARKLKHTYATANNGLEAVQLYKKSLEGQEPCFSLVFMDISMPVMNGFEATREIRQLEIAAGVPRTKIVALTGLRSDVNGDEATASGLDLFLTKPVKMSTVKELLDGIQAGS
ncbi:hypothetical protein C7999DRAFT_41704 [Corynascus novoguineensis]|uniref:Uncharacterized protein n=1 Tax=Corynascus novoguineensis TaxID=1126955 RepID=A0AAN7CRX1_9PEZI|nr:hypothetical protein C7999DRAFT_41704 [Corynascus novoguineensis]